MAKRLVLIACIWLMLCVPVMAESWTVWDGDSWEDLHKDDEPPEEFVVPVGDADGTTDSMLEYVFALSDAVTQSNYVEYNDGFPSSQYLDFAERLLPRVKPGQSYVFARTGQYQYIMAIGEFDSSFSGSADVYVLNLANYNTKYSFYMVSDDSFKLNVAGGMVYSNYAPYPNLGYDWSIYVLGLLILFLVCAVVYSLARICFHSLSGWR